MKNTKKTVKKEDPANELLEALNTLARENKLDRDMLLDALKTAMEAARRHGGDVRARQRGDCRLVAVGRKGRP